MIKRKLQAEIESFLFKKKIIIIYGPRQVGKTTISKAMLSKFGEKGLYLNCEIESVQEIFSEVNPEKIKAGLQGKEIVVLDEAQTILNIGKKLKVLFDAYPEIQIIATGSSSFDLANKTKEALTGRSVEFVLWPLSVAEILENSNLFDYKNKESLLFRFGMYPEVYLNNQNESFATSFLENIYTNYLYKDILMYENLKKPTLLTRLLKSLAFRIGGEISLNSLSNELDVSIQTIEKYLDLLEQIFIVKRLFSYSNNKEKALRKKFKVYFVDIGIRNAVVSQFGNVENRNDVGAIFENFIIIEKMKKDMFASPRKYKNYYFWRDYGQREIDLVEEFDGKKVATEIKFSKEKINQNSNKHFSEYIGPEAVDFSLINKYNYLDYLK